MKILVIDTSQDGVPFALRAQANGHSVRVFQPPRTTGESQLAGKGMITQVREWKPLMNWADLIVMTGNSMYGDDLEPYYEKGYPIIGANKRAAALELDRKLGDDALKLVGVETLPYEVFDTIEEALAHVHNTGITYVCKAWGGVEDKSLSFVAKSPADMIFRLEQCKRLGKMKGKLMLQEKVKGVEMACAAWFGPGGFGQWKREVFEEKKFLNEGLGQNTGEMGTTIRYTKKSQLFDEVLAPMEEYLHGTGYVGNVDVNCIIVGKKAWPLEFTMRFGWPGYNIESALHLGDEAERLYDLWCGTDSLRVREGKVAVGVVMAHGDFPNFKWCPEEVSGHPITGITASMEKDLWPQWVMKKKAPVMKGDEIVVEETLCTAGHIPFTVTGIGDTVEQARCSAYKTAWKIDWPSNRMFRTDIGCRLEKQLLELQQHGYAKGMRYD